MAKRQIDQLSLVDIKAGDSVKCIKPSNLPDNIRVFIDSKEIHKVAKVYSPKYDPILILEDCPKMDSEDNWGYPFMHDRFEKITV